MTLLLSSVAALVSLAVLAYSADSFVAKAGSLAKSIGMPSFVIGALILGFGTSAPEMVVSVLSALEGAPELALGNAIGSNISNIALVLGITLLIGSIAVDPRVVKVDMTLLLLISALLMFLMWDLHLSAPEGYTLLALLAAYIVFSLNRPGGEPDLADIEPPTDSRGKELIWGLVWLALMLGSSQALVLSAVSIATLLNVSELVIGLTVVAIGTSMPELVASIAAARQGDQQMALGNIIGSNLFNTLGVVGLAVVVSPFSVSSLALNRDMVFCTALTLALLLVSTAAYRMKKSLGKVVGVVLLASFTGYTALLITTSL